MTKAASPADGSKHVTDSNRHSLSLHLEPEDNQRLTNLCGQFDQHLHQIEKHFDVIVSNRAFDFTISGLPLQIQKTINLLQELYDLTATEQLAPEKIHLFLQESNHSEAVLDDDGKVDPNKDASVTATIRTKRGLLRGRGPNQNFYIRSIQTHDLTFGIGPAGTGKTYLAVACAVEALERDEVRRIVLVRPAVEAGEKLGFLPGDLSQKVDPYLRPMYDALYEMLGFEKVDKLIEKNVIEVAPLAYMRGRTLNDSFIIMDEAQNTTAEQMKMFLTRIGFGSTVVVTGDITQIDLPNNQRSGLKHVIDILQGVKEIRFSFFESKDVVRHSLVQRIVDLYEKYEA
ncbi:PhoH family protein [Cocleimonas sp. KMM 6892]|uniref:PhoH family protein n=1 Tax=unclassified Cocleimonas TaxID=2639732 RepID=UPI002DBBFDBF|nr:MULTISPECIES: PhoH family protein [unclassified Cocleimonas]MEB8433484.1 PhoH family protein [Cocleimonas sp. KMM 6892]MEC4716295.1 PhoH family protein [Cocleimonas sp. KMM 6895]MEC4745812.1 PhoH family protein [Cocleimonas sp. KMM 6896]